LRAFLGLGWIHFVVEREAYWIDRRDGGDVKAGGFLEEEELGQGSPVDS